MILRAGQHRIDLGTPAVMGVLNVTPDSFSDGGRFHSFDDAVRRAESMLAEGAAIIDVGGESTRPGADEIPLQEELDRVMPLVEYLTSRLDICVSVDTSKPEVMSVAAQTGAGLINDVFGLRHEGAIPAVAAEDCAVCVMHMQGVPRSMQQKPAYDDVAVDVTDFLQERIVACEAGGIDTSRIVVDPGFGFGKTDTHNIALLAKLESLQRIGRPILVGLSRKRTLGKLTGREVGGRMPAGLAAAVLAVERGAAIVRTHDVAETVDALRIAAAVMTTGDD